jgi:hypothetical protein
MAIVEETSDAENAVAKVKENNTSPDEGPGGTSEPDAQAGKGDEAKDEGSEKGEEEEEEEEEYEIEAIISAKKGIFPQVLSLSSVIHPCQWLIYILHSG